MPFTDNHNPIILKEYFPTPNLTPVLLTLVNAILGLFDWDIKIYNFNIIIS